MMKKPKVIQMSELTVAERKLLLLALGYDVVDNYLCIDFLPITDRYTKECLNFDKICILPPIGDDGYACILNEDVFTILNYLEEYERRYGELLLEGTQ